MNKEANRLTEKKSLKKDLESVAIRKRATVRLIPEGFCAFWSSLGSPGHVSYWRTEQIVKLILILFYSDNCIIWSCVSPLN